MEVTTKISELRLGARSGVANMSLKWSRVANVSREWSRECGSQMWVANVSHGM